MVIGLIDLDMKIVIEDGSIGGYMDCSPALEWSKNLLQNCNARDKFEQKNSRKWLACFLIER